MNGSQGGNTLKIINYAMALIALVGGAYLVMLFADMADMYGSELLVPVAAFIVGFLGVRQVGKEAPPALFVVGGVALAVLSVVGWMLFVKGI
jgi:hypothetical protein